MARVVWRFGTGRARLTNKVTLPKKPVKWWGEAWFLQPDGTKLTTTWHSKTPIIYEDAYKAMHAVVADLRVENGENGAIDAGFYMECR